MDLPLHGVTDTTQVPIYQASNEQTFNLDLIVNSSGAAGPDGVIDPTGTHFINLSYPLASRDNLRQGVVNLLALTRALPGLDLVPEVPGALVWTPPDLNVDVFSQMELEKILGWAESSLAPGRQ